MLWIWNTWRSSSLLVLMTYSQRSILVTLITPEEASVVFRHTVVVPFLAFELLIRLHPHWDSLYDSCSDNTKVPTEANTWWRTVTMETHPPPPPPERCPLQFRTRTEEVEVTICCISVFLLPIEDWFILLNRRHKSHFYNCPNHWTGSQCNTH